MAFWQNQMPWYVLAVRWGASHIADPKQELTLDAYCRQKGNHISKLIPSIASLITRRWYQSQAVRDLEKNYLVIRYDLGRPRVQGNSGRTAKNSYRKRVVVATGINNFANRPVQFTGIPSELSSHTGGSTLIWGNSKAGIVVVIGAGQSALESAALFKEEAIGVEVIGRVEALNWVGLHPKLHHTGMISRMLYSTRDVGPSKELVDWLRRRIYFEGFPERFQNRTAYRAIRPAGAGWLKPRLEGVPITLGRTVVSATTPGSQLLLKLDDGTERLIDHALLATGFRVNVSKYPFLSQSLVKQLRVVNGYPVLKRGLECSIPGLHFAGKPARVEASVPLLGFVSGTEFAANELVQSMTRRNGSR